MGGFLDPFLDEVGQVFDGRVLIQPALVQVDAELSLHCRQKLDTSEGIEVEIVAEGRVRV